MTGPRYPIYVISKGRWERPLTARFLKADGVPFRIVVEPQERDHYIKAVGEQHVLVLPFSNLGQGSIPTRNWCWEHAKAAGYARHWILDDNIYSVTRRLRLDGKIKRRRMNSLEAFVQMEHLADRWDNCAILGPNYKFLAPDWMVLPPFRVNAHVYSFILIQNDLPFRWRGRYNEDTDLCLQAISRGYCTVQVQAFLAEKVRTQTMKGGNTDQLYQGDGRLKMARSLERVWPGVVQTKRRFGRPQHVVNWGKFRTPLIPKKLPDE